MKYAENNRISHRQLTRQLVLSLTAPFLLGLLGYRSMLGANGMLASVAVLIPLYFYVIFLIRLTPYYANLPKYVGKWCSLLIGVFYLSFTVFTGAYQPTFFVFWQGGQPFGDFSLQFRNS